MPKVRNLLRPHASPRAKPKTPPCRMHWLNWALACSLLAAPALSNAGNQCAELFERQSLPPGAQTILAERALRINQMPYCLHAYETDWQPSQVLAHYQDQWRLRGQAHTNFAIHQPNANTLMAMMGARHYRVHVTKDNKLTAVSLSRMQANGNSPPAANRNGLSIPGFRVFYEQSNQAGRSLALISDKSQPAAVKQVLSHFQQQGWQIESKQLVGGQAPTQEPTARASLSRGSRLLEVTVQSHLGQSQVLLEFIKASHGHER